jgi:hypothetical protein
MNSCCTVGTSVCTNDNFNNFVVSSYLGCIAARLLFVEYWERSSSLLHTYYSTHIVSNTYFTSVLSLLCSNLWPVSCSEIPVFMEPDDLLLLLLNHTQIPLSAASLNVIYSKFSKVVFFCEFYQDAAVCICILHHKWDMFGPSLFPQSVFANIWQIMCYIIFFWLLCLSRWYSLAICSQSHALHVFLQW